MGDGVAQAQNQIGRTPKEIVWVKGSEFVSKAMDQWSYRNGMDLKFIQPGKPTQNAFIESFNGSFRMDCLDQNWFEDLDYARSVIEAWRIEYDTPNDRTWRLVEKRPMHLQGSKSGRYTACLSNREDASPPTKGSRSQQVILIGCPYRATGLA